MNYSQAAGGLRIENYLDPNRPDFGDIVLSTSESGSALKRALMKLNADVAGTRKLYDASIEAAKMGAAGAENLANANTVAEGLGAAGKFASAAISTIPLPGGGGGIGGSGIGSGITGTVDFNKDFTSGIDFSDIYQNPDLVGWME